VLALFDFLTKSNPPARPRSESRYIATQHKCDSRRSVAREALEISR
jgi:hypothetical protein